MATDDSALTLSQRAFVNFNSLRGAATWLYLLISAVILINSLALIAWPNIEIKSYGDFILLTIIVSLVLCVYVIAWSIVKGPRAYKRFQEWEEDYVEIAYILVFSTTIPKGTSTGEKVLNLSKMVFPQLRPDLFSSPLDKPTTSAFVRALLRKILHKGDNSTDSTNSNIYDYQVDAFNLDVALKTDFGYFLIKDFDKKEVSVEDIEKLVKVVRSNFKIFRIVCVASAYDSSLKEELLESNMIKFSEIKIDLLLKEKTGYSLQWIS
jgi:hypothetical protein